MPKRKARNADANSSPPAKEPRRSTRHVQRPREKEQLDDELSPQDPDIENIINPKKGVNPKKGNKLVKTKELIKDDAEAVRPRRLVNVIRFSRSDITCLFRDAIAFYLLS